MTEAEKALKRLAELRRLREQEQARYASQDAARTRNDNAWRTASKRVKGTTRLPNGS